MKPPPAAKGPRLTRFRAQLLAAMALVVLAVTAAGLYVAQRKVAAETEHDWQRDFQSELDELHRVQEIRHAVLAERCRTLVRRPRIHAAFEDNALDLLYPSAKDELRDLMEAEQSPEAAAYALRAKFYRFLDAQGAVISPPKAHEVGELRQEEEAQLALRPMPDRQQLGYLARRVDGAGEEIAEVISMPIVSTETGEVIAALVAGFKPAEIAARRANSEIKSGIWLNGRLHMPALAKSAQTILADEVTRAVAAADDAESNLRIRLDGAQHQLFFKRLNPGSLFPPAYEVCLYPFDRLLARQRKLSWQAAVACALLLLGGTIASHFLSARLSRPVERLAVDSEENRAHWERAEAELELTSEELQRAARFSADASHQLKTPVTVLRAGLGELLAQEDLTTEARDEISVLVHQTYRLTNIIEDLLLLSKIDAGRLQLDFGPVNLTQLIEAGLDDLSALPGAAELHIETGFPADLHIAGEKRYTALILQNLLENARKYNRLGGRIRIAARVDGECVFLTVANTGRPIPPAMREHIFERFHRGSSGENIPGHGLGLNLARELARVHSGDLRLIRSDESWTEFEVRFRLAQPAPVPNLEVA